MPRLILVNGAPGTGKSTLARRYAVEHPLTVALDIDVVRSLIGGWRDLPMDAGILARRLSLAMIRTALTEGRDVVVPQLLGQAGFIDDLAAAAADVGVPFVEIVVTTPPGTAERRFRARSAAATDDHQVAVVGEDPDELVGRYAAAVRAVVADRPQTVVIDNPDGEEEEAYRALLAAVSASEEAGPPGDRPVAAR